MALKVGELFASFGVQGVDEALKGVEAKCKAMESTLKGIGQSLGASITQPITSFAKSVYETGSAFDAQMSKVAAIAGISMDEVGGAFDDLAAKAKEMGATTSFTATEAGEALEYMAMAGWTDKQMLEALKPVMDLAAASGANLGTASDIVTDAMTAFGMTADEAAHFSDVLAAASSSANTNVEMMGETFKYVAPVAGSLGYSVEDMAVAIGLMANSGIKASSAGTALRNILTNMAKPTDDMKQAMEELGVSLDDGEGHMKDFATVMKELRKGFGGMKISQEELISSFSELDKSLSSGSISQSDYEAATARLMERAYGAEGALKAQAAAALAGKFGMSGLLAIVNASDDDFEKLTKAIQECDGATEKMVAKMLDNAQGDMVLFQSALDGVKMSLWDLSEGSVRSVIQQLTGMANAFIALDDGTRSAIIKLAAFAAAMGPAMLAGGKLLSVVQAIGPALSALTGPVGIAAAGFALIGLAAMDTDGKLGDSMLSMSNSVYKGMKDLSGKMQTGLKTLSKRIPAMAGKIGSSLANVVRSGIGLAADAVSGIGDIFQQSAGSFSNVAMQLVSSIVGGISTNLPKLLDGGAKIATGIISGLIRNIPSLVRTAISAIQSGFSALLTLDWGSYGRTILDSIASALGGLSQTLLGFASNWLDALDSVDWQHAGANIWNSIKNGISSAVRGAKNFLTELILGSGISQGGVMSLANYGQTTWETIKSGFVEKSGDWLKKLVLGDDYQPDSSWGDVGVKIWGVITGAIDSLKAATKNIVGQIALGEKYNPEKDGWDEIGTAIWKKITDTVTNLRDKTKNIVGQIVLGEEYTADTSWDQIGTAIWEAIKAKIDNLKAAAKNIVGQIVLGEEYTPGTSWDQIGEAIWGAIGTKIEALKAAAKNIVGPVVLGEAYNEDTSSWHDISEKIWGAIGDKLVELKNATKNIVGKIALGEHYTADTTWGQIGEAIWTKIKERFAELKKNALGLIGKLVLGEEYTADTSWQDVGIAIWDMIKAGFAELSKNAKDIIGRLALGSEYKADDTWSDVGEAIWKKAKEGVKDTGDWLKAQLGYSPSDDWKTIGGDLFEKVKEGLGNAATAAGDWIKTTLGFSADDSWTAVGSDIFGKIRAGLVSALETLGQGLGAIIRTLFGAGDATETYNLGADIAGFIWEGCKAGIMALFEGLPQFLIGFINGLFGINMKEARQEYIAFAEAAADDVGNTIAERVGAPDPKYREAGIAAIAQVMDGIEIPEGTDFSDIANNVSDLLNLAFDESAKNNSGFDGFIAYVKDKLTTWNLTEDDFAGMGEEFWDLAYRAMLGEEDALNELMAFLTQTGKDSVDAYQQSINGVPVSWDAVFNTSLSEISGWQTELEAQLSEMGVEAGSLLGVALPDGVVKGLAEGTMSIQEAAAALAEAAKVKEADTAKAVTDNKTTGESAGEAVATGMSNKEGDITTAGTTVEEAAVATFETFAEDMKTPTDAAMVGVKEAITGHQSEISTASAEVSRDAVQKFAETMTAGEGKAIADSFMDAMNTALSEKGSTIKTTAETAAKDAKKAASDALAQSEGNSIGYNFVTGLGNGISSRMYWLQSRAREVAAAAADAARSALNEHSPSRVMMQVGKYFTEGFGKGIMGAAGSAVRAAAGMAKAAINAVSMPMSSSAGKGFASDLSVALPRRAAGGETVQRSTTYNNNSPLIVQQMNVRKESDIDAIAHEINALRARTAYGFGS